MNNLKNFIDKVYYVESRQGKTLALSITEARALRDDLSKLLLDTYEVGQHKVSLPEPTFQVELIGRKF